MGREAELASLRAFLRAVPAGSRALVLAGEAGLGKTTLWNFAVTEAQRRSYRVLTARPAASEAAYPYAALGDLFEELDESVLDCLSGAPREALEVALLRAEPARKAHSPRAVAAAVRQILRALAAGGPVVVAVDDAQWLDPPTAGALSFALRRLDRHPVGTLLGVRCEGGPAVPLTLERDLDDRRLTVLALEPLEPEPMSRLLFARLGTALPLEVFPRLYEASEGNPFFALELGRALLRTGVTLVPDAPLPVPASLRTLVEERLTALAPEAREALLAASALARPTRALVDSATYWPAWATGGLSAAVDAGVLELEGERVRLTHPLLASVAYAETPPEQRRDLHARLASMVEDPEERARHLVLAAVGPDDQVALALDEGARRARARGASQVAAGLAEQAVRLTPPHLTDEIRRRAFEAGDHHMAAGELDSARRLMEEARRSAPSGPDRARALQRLGEIRAQEQGFPAAEELFTEALAEAGDDGLLQVEIECDLAFVRLVSGDVPGATERAGTALERAEALEGLPRPVLLTALSACALMEFLSGRGVRHDLLARLAAIEEWAVREAVAVRPGYLPLRHVPATLHKWSDELEAADEEYRAALARSTELGEESWQPWLLHQMSEFECWTGHWDEAERHAGEADELAERTGQQGVRAYTLYALALMAAHRGRVAEARSACEEGLAICRRRGIVLAGAAHEAVLGFLALSLGETAAAGDLLASVRATLDDIGLRDPGVVRCLPDEIETLVALGRLDLAESLTERLLEQGRALRRPWALATGSRCRGLVRAARGDWDDALECLAQAHKEHEAHPLPFEEARTLLVEGAVRRRAKQKRPAREALEAALLGFEELGAPLWAAKARAELLRIGGRSGQQSLTPTESRVAALVAAGSTNREVATALFMSIKTVESNLRQIYRKLGVASRRELARLDPPPTERETLTD